MVAASPPTGRESARRAHRARRSRPCERNMLRRRVRLRGGRFRRRFPRSRWLGSRHLGDAAPADACDPARGADVTVQAGETLGMDEIRKSELPPRPLPLWS